MKRRIGSLLVLALTGCSGTPAPRPEIDPPPAIADAGPAPTPRADASAPPTPFPTKDAGHPTDPGPGTDAGPIADAGHPPGPSTPLCADTGYAHCESTDFATESIVGNPKWEISTWSIPNRTHSASNVWVQDGVLVMKVNGGTTPGAQTTGAEIATTKTDFLYGSYRALAKTAAEPGTVSSPIFYYLSDTSEIDVEILSVENPKKLVNFTIHENNKGANTYKLYAAGFDPSADFHEYRFDWSPQGVTYFIDGKPTGVTLTGNTPYRPGRIMVNHWTLSDPGWGGGPPVHDAFMYIKHFEFYY
jgi:hypothetical protein